MSLVFSSSGIIGGKRRDFETALKQALVARYRGVFFFIGNPLKELPHLLMSEPEVRKDPLAAHAYRWGVLNSSCERVSAALKAGKIPLVESFGLDVHTPVVALSDESVHGALRKQQSENVASRVVANNIPPPFYLLLPLDEDNVVRDIRAVFPRLNYYPPRAIEKFAIKQWAAINDYFTKISGQNPPIWIRGNSMGEMVEYAISEIARVAGLPYETQRAQAAD